ncbi:MAG: response regulator [Bacteroidota bacterium]
MKINRKNIYYSFLVFAVLEIVLNLNIRFNRETNIKSAINSQINFIERNYNVSIASYRNFSTSIYDSIINNKAILKLVHEINTSPNPDIYRAQLEDKLNYIYKVIKYKNFRVFHFHDKDGHSILRFHKPYKYGDDLKGFRLSIANISKNHNYIEGFEEGRIINSYRFIYPLFYENSYVGSVEMSVSIYDLLKEIQDNFDGSVDFLLADNIVDKVINNSTRELYTPTPFNGYSCYVSPDFNITTSGNSNANQMPFSKLELNTLNIEVAPKFEEDNHSKKTFYELIWHEGHAVLVSFIPINNVDGKQVAFVIYHQHFTDAEIIRSNYSTMLIVGNIIVFIVAFLAFFVFSSRQMAIEQGMAVKAAKERAEEISRLKSDFLANMSHEIRTPMNGVVGMVEILKNTNVSKQQNEYLEIINNSANNLLTVINDILDFSKIESNKITLENIPFSIRKVIDEVGDTVFLKAEKQGISFITYTDPKLAEFVYGDPIRLRQVVLNFVNNAIKFTEKGKVFVGADILNETDDTVQIAIKIEDTGMGISEEAQKTLFESFTQADTSITRKYGGTGLGLTISKKLVDLMKGRVEVKSELGKGSVFSCIITFNKAQGIQESHNINQTDLSHLRVLIVDDNKDNRLIFSKYLDIWNIKSSLANSVDEAVEIMQKAVNAGKCFDIALVDFQMPEKTGFDFASILIKENILKNTKLILLSSISDMFTSTQIKNAGFSTFLYKPIKLSQFQDVLFDVVNHSIGDQVDKIITTKPKTDGVKDLKILLVEDNLINQKVATIALKQLGYKNDIANNGQEAYDMYLKTKYDLILMDIQMPVLDGVGAANRIRHYEKEHNFEKRVLIVAITANAMKTDVELYLNSGMDDVILKPFKQDELSKLLDGIV